MLSAREFRKLLFYLFTVPALAYLTFAYAQDRQQSAWATWLEEQSPRLSPEERELSIICADRETNLVSARACTLHTWLTRFRMLALATALLAAAVLVAVPYVGRRCRRKPELLLKVFRGGAHLMTGATIFFLVAQAALLGAMLWLVAALFSGAFEFLVGLALLTSFAAAVALYRVGRMLATFNSEFSFEGGRGGALTRECAPELWKLVTATAQAVGIAPPGKIVGCADVNFYASSCRTVINGRTETGHILFVSVPLCHVFTVGEYHAIVAHEMAHFRAQDAEFSLKFYAPYRKGMDTLTTMSASANSSGVGGYVLLPAMYLLWHYLQSFTEAEADWSRVRELAADAVAASVTSRRDVALALVKVSGHDEAWEAAYTELLGSEHDVGAPARTISELFQESAERTLREENRSERIKRLQGERLRHPTDSHPPLGARLAALGFTVAEMYDVGSDLRPEQPASVLIPGARELEIALMPAFAPKSEAIRSTFGHRQAGFAAIEFRSVFRNRSFLVFVASEGLYGMKFSDSVRTPDLRYFEEPAKVFEDPWFVPGNPEFHEAMKESRNNFFLPANEIAAVEFDATPRWGMGAIPHVGKLRVRLTSGRARELVVLGEVDGDGVRRVILERIGRA